MIYNLANAKHQNQRVILILIYADSSVRFLFDLNTAQIFIFNY
jgi:hypothetical protein